MEVSFGERKIRGSKRKKVPHEVKESKKGKATCPEERCGDTGRKPS